MSKQSTEQTYKSRLAAIATIMDSVMARAAAKGAVKPRFEITNEEWIRIYSMANSASPKKRKSQS